MTPRVKSILWQIVGYGFLVLGILGIFLPILQGFLFLMVALVILSKHAPWARRLRDWLKARYPSVDMRIHRAEVWLRAWSMRQKARWRNRKPFFS
ncbi:PGPGW domain-containing protein [Marinivivus vitaminiproducens]|uniref:PGPGW domain-containing protein n=1 Tax=Marinivivus vitaminiproducens TaxID=3035935 RepID=UPI00279CCAE7|nr:PGPGW domain-containing protein [Geminicoccaceae bacterium SCSIO 64248]